MNFKKMTRIVMLTILIILATIGIGISGAIPISGSNKKDEFIEVKTEQLDDIQEKDSESDSLEVIP